MNHFYNHRTAVELQERVQLMNIYQDDEKLRSFTFFSANVLHFMPDSNAIEHEHAFKQLCLHQHLSHRDEHHRNLDEQVSIRGLDNSFFKRIRLTPGIICTYHLGSYRLINRLLAAAQVPFSLVVNTRVFQEEANCFQDGFEKVSGSAGFNIIDAEKPNAFISMAKAIKKGHNLVIYVDGNTGSNSKTSNNVTVDFMAGQLSVRKGVAVLANLLKCPIYPVSCTRSSLDAIDYEIHEPISPPRVEERLYFVEETMQKLYGNLERLLQKDPFQWECWLYLHQYMVSIKQSPRMISATVEELTDSRLWGVFKEGETCFALDKRRFLSFEIDDPIYDFIRNTYVD